MKEKENPDCSILTAPCLTGAHPYIIGKRLYYTASHGITDLASDGLLLRIVVALLLALGSAGSPRLRGKVRYTEIAHRQASTQSVNGLPMVVSIAVS